MEGFRLSPQQALLDKLALGGSRGRLWSQQLLLEIHGVVEEDRLRAVAFACAAAHEICRTGFENLSGVPVQVVGETAPAWSVIELAGKSPAEIESEISEVRARAASEIPGSEDPSIALTYMRSPGSGDVAFLLIACSPLVADADTLVYLARDIVDSYANAGKQSRAASADDERLEYADISEWLNTILEDDDARAERQYWQSRHELLDAAAPRAAAESPATAYAYERVTVGLDGSVDESIAGISERTGTSPALVLLAAWGAMNARLTETSSVICGTYSNGRVIDELEGSPGPLGRSLPLVIGPLEESTLIDLVTSTADEWRELEGRQEHYDLRSGPIASGDAGKAAWDLAFAAYSAALPPAGAQADFRVRDVIAHDVPFRVKLVARTGGTATPAVELWFDPAFVQRNDAEILARRYAMFLQAALASPDTAVAELPLLIDDDLPATEANLRAEELDAIDGGVLDGLRTLGTRDASASAVSVGGATWTYGQLSAWSNRISHRLLDSGVGPDTPVGICIPRRPELISAIVGVLNAGAGYVPIDPEYPSERVAQVLGDSGARILLTTRDTAAGLSLGDVEVIHVEADAGQLAACPEDLPAVDAAPDSLAYILYTSGSTGKPKGVAVSRANLAHSTAARQAYYGETPEAFLLLSSVAFDSSVAGIFWTLLGGGHLVLHEGGTGIDTAELATACRTHKPTHTLCLPSVYALMLDEIDAGDMSSLDCVIVAGESCPAAIVSKHFAKSPGRRMYNEYGPTEGTVWSVAHRFSADEDLSAGVPIGMAVPGYSVAVLDHAGQPLPVGCRGELYIAGKGVARGYWGRDDLSAERFKEIELPRYGRARAYRTGDIVQLRSNGCLDFFGRRDNQIKVNGYRIELEEVESAMKALAGVEDAAAVVRATDGPEPQLCAFIRTDGALDAATVAASLSSRLPRYMVPAVITALPELPRMPNGKIDRAALVSLPLASRPEREFVPPRDELEQLQADIWAELLEAETIGISDDFFRIGGHSILATRLVARLRDYLQIQIPIRMIFDYPTIADFTDALRADPGTRRKLGEIQALLAASD